MPPQGEKEKDVGVGLKAVWYGAEVFGKVLSLGKDKTSTPSSSDANTTTGGAAKMTRDQMLAAIKTDYDQQYFVRGVGDMSAYAPDCTFSDPFVSFKGTQRFKQNVGNLGGLMSDIKLDVYEWEEGPASLQTKWRFSCILDLPWKPRLAAAGGTTHVLDLQRGVVVGHDEQWAVEPSKVVAQLLLPSAKVPSNAWETLLLAAADGDGKGVWFVLSPSVIKVSVPIIGVSLLTKLITGEGLPGAALGALEGLAYLGFASAAITEVVKFAQGMQGGETGTGGRF